MSSPEPDVLWTPDPERSRETAIAAFARFVRDERGVDVGDTDYAALHDWSVTDMAGFWSAAAEFLGVRFRDVPDAVLGSTTMPGTQWFPGATLNYAEHALASGAGRDDDVAAGVRPRRRA